MFRNILIMGHILLWIPSQSCMHIRTCAKGSLGARAHKAILYKMVDRLEAGSDPRGHLWVTWGVYLWAGKPPLADVILSHPPDLT